MLLREEPDHKVWRTLVVAALLAGRPLMDSRARSALIANVEDFDPASPHDAVAALRAALSRTGREPHLIKSLPPRSLEAARRQADTWFREGIRVYRGVIPLPGDPPQARPPQAIFGWGTRSLICPGTHMVTVFNSRTRRKAAPTDQWLRATVALWEIVARGAHTVVSSYGPLSYELVSYLCLHHDRSLVVVCPEALPHMRPKPARVQFLLQYGRLFRRQRLLFLSPFAPGSLPLTGERQTTRDWLIALLVSAFGVASVRASGTVEHIIRHALSRGKAVHLFVPQIPDRETAHNRTVGESLSSPGLNKVRLTPSAGSSPKIVSHQRSEDGFGTGEMVLAPWPEPGKWLAHYTRACPGPWPGQSLVSYLEALVNGADDGGHTAFDTLRRILRERLIRGSARLTRGRDPVVSFTERLPGQLDGMLMWRPGLVRWSVEPYGLAIRREALDRRGVAPVVYGTEAWYESLPAKRRPFFQLSHSRGFEWTAEQEWRIVGDLPLGHLRPRDIVVITATVEEARLLAREFPYPITLAGVGMDTRSIPRVPHEGGPVSEGEDD